MEKRILTVQDISCVGQCSLTVALPIISACGIETAILPSAVLSTHTAGFKDFTCLSLTEEFPKIINHWQKENITFDGVYTGYVLGEQIDHIIEICTKLNKGVKIIDPVMADHGKFYYGFDKAFAQKIKDLTCEGHNEIVFVIGGANGLSKEVSDRANFKLSFSKMTFTHQLVRVFLYEQIYRAFKIINNESYHR